MYCKLGGGPVVDAILGFSLSCSFLGYSSSRWFIRNDSCWLSVGWRNGSMVSVVEVERFSSDLALGSSARHWKMVGKSI